MIDQTKGRPLSISCPTPQSDDQIIRLGHGSGGRMTASLIEKIFLPAFDNAILNRLDDAAQCTITGGTMAMTTDSYVVSPIFFPGGDIGSLSVHGTVNDLAMSGARPLYLSATFILEEGLAISDLQKIVNSMSRACRECGVIVVTADTKVVNRGCADKLFITTTGVGKIEMDSLPAPGAHRAQEGDCVIVSGDIGRHGVAVMSCREGLELETEIESDSFAMHNIVHSLLEKATVHCLRDVTRGGLTGVLNELAQSSKVGIEIDESAVPIHPQVKGVCELLGLDPFYVACEGRLVAIVPEQYAQKALESIRQEQERVFGNLSGFEQAQIIGRVVSSHPGRVILRSLVGGNRILDKLAGEQLPRIC